MDKPKLLVLCPSRGRAKRIHQMLDSYEKTVDFNHTRLHVLIDKDDKDFKQYVRTMPSWAEIKVFDRQYDSSYTTEIINRAFYMDKDYEFYSVINDDIEFLTEGWDKGFCNKGKITTGIDKGMVKFYENRNQVINMKGFPIISGVDGDIPRALGWLQHPNLKHTGGDNVWYWIGKRLDAAVLDESIVWNHNTAFLGMGEADETYLRTDTTNTAMMDDYYVYQDWLKFKIHKDINKIKHNAPHLFIKEKELCQTQEQ